MYRFSRNSFFALCCCMALSISSCTDLLNEPLQNVQLIEDRDYTQFQDMPLLLDGAYAQFYTMQWETHPLIGIRGDDVNAAGDQVPLTSTDEFFFDRNFWMYNSTWLNLYSDILIWHGAIEEFNRFREAGADVATVDQYIAEVKVFQGFQLLHLARLWGNILIPSESAPSHLFDKPVSTFDEVMQHIVNLMDEAIPDLPALHPSERTDLVGGVTRYTALTVKAMAQLELRNYSGVVAATDEIIASGRYELFEDYYQLFKRPGELARESILEAQFSDFGQASGTNISFNFSPYGPASWAPAVQGASNGWGFWEPSLKYIKFMLERGETIRLETSVLFTPDGIARIQEDPQFAQLPEFVSNTTRDGDTFNNHPRYLFLSGKHYLPSVQLTPGRFGYGTGNNFRIIRYSEVLLMHAEAIANGASSSVLTAAEAVNQVRARSGLAPLTTVTLDDVLDEKFAEFGMEWGVRFADLIRHGRFQELSREGRNFNPQEHTFLPYPLEQIDILPQLRAAQAAN